MNDNTPKPWYTAPTWRPDFDSLPADEQEVTRRKDREMLEQNRDFRSDRPNILFLFTDQQSFRALSATGNAHVNTPHMDYLASRGTRFETCYCTSPVCSPARSSFLTGRMPHETGVVYNGLPIDDSLPTMGEVFRNAGYETIWSGKWHLPESYVRTPDGIRGFDNLPRPSQRNLHGLGDQVDFNYTIDAEFMLRYELHKIRKPWLYCVSLHNPHDICHWTEFPPRHHANLASYPPLPDNAKPNDSEPDLVGIVRKSGAENKRTLHWDDNQWRAYVSAYYHLTEQVDRAVGLVIEALEEGGWADNTLVVFTSDHGDMCAGHQLAAKSVLYEEAVRVPLILSMPGTIPEGKIDNETLTSGLDILPTFCDYAGITPPKCHGRSLRNAIESRLNRDFVVGEMFYKQQNAAARMVRSHNFKYCSYPHGTIREELFNLNEDPLETKNLAREPEYSDELETHRSMLMEWAKETQDNLYPATNK